MNGINMEEIDSLYEKLIINSSASPCSCNIDAKVRTEIYKKILDDLDAFIEKQRCFKTDSDEYGKLDLQIRLRLLKEIQGLPTPH